MIICVSANPAIDRRLRVDRLKIGQVNRAASVEEFAGGKAAHVAMAATALGEPTTWIGFLGGATGDKIERQLADLGINVVRVRTTAITRINDEIIDADGQITEILEPGGQITAAELESIREACIEQFAVAGKGFQLVLSGSLPPNVPDDFYADITARAEEYGGSVILDASGAALLKGLAVKPDLVKPNIHETAAATGIEISDEAAMAAAAARLRQLGAKSVALSLGASGIFWAGHDGSEMMHAVPPSVDVISSVGCGDATVAGFAVAASRGLNMYDTLRLAAACGTANCLAAFPGQIDLDEVERLSKLIMIKNIGR